MISQKCLPWFSNVIFASLIKCSIPIYHWFYLVLSHSISRHFLWKIPATSNSYISHSVGLVLSQPTPFFPRFYPMIRWPKMLGNIALGQYQHRSLGSDDLGFFLFAKLHLSGRRLDFDGAALRRNPSPGESWWRNQWLWEITWCNDK